MEPVIIDSDEEIAVVAQPALDYQCLEGRALIDDIVINDYLSLIQLTSRSSSNFPKIYAFKTYFLVKWEAQQNNGLVQQYNAVKNLTRRVNIFTYDLLLIPINIRNMHWAIVVVNIRNKFVIYYDPKFHHNNFEYGNLIM